MHLVAAIGSALLFLSSLSLAFSDAAWAARTEAVSAPVAAKRTFAYGRDPRQTLDYWEGRGPAAPLVVFVHGGAWKMGDKRMMTGSAKLTDWQAHGYAVHEGPLIRSDLYLADEVFMTGTAAEVTPVRAIDDHEIGPPGPVTKAIQSTFFEVVRGRDERWTRWLEYAAKAPAGS